MPSPKGTYRCSNGKPTCDNLPYDPEEWEQRLVAARAKRESILQRRGGGRQRTSCLPDGQMPNNPSLRTVFSDWHNAPRQPRRKADETGDRKVDEDVLILGGAGAARMRADALPAERGAEHRSTSLRAPSEGMVVAASAASATRPESDAEVPPPWPAGRIRPALFGLVIGCVAGASFATFGGIGQSISELRGRGTALVPFAGTLPPDVPAGAAPSLAPLAEARISSAVLAPVLLPEATSEEEAPVAMAGPPKTAAVPANLHVEFGGADVRPTVPSTPVTPGAPPPAPPRDADFLVNHAREDPALPHVPAVLAVPGAPAVVALRDATALSFRPRRSRIVVQAPQNMPRNRREAALSRLAGSDWPAEEAASSPFTVSETHVRYYHPQDRRAAEDLAGLFKASARDFTGYTPSPDEGLLELWLSGKGAPSVIRQARTRSTQPGAAANSATPTRSSPRGTNVFDRIANALEGTSGGSSRGTWREVSDNGPSGSARGESGSRSRSASSDDGRSSVSNGRRGDDGRGGDRSGAGGAGGSSSGGGVGSSPGSGGSSSSGGAPSSSSGESSSGGGSPSAGSSATSGAANGNASGGRGGTDGGNGGGRGNSRDHARGSDNAGGNGKGGGNNGRGGGNGGGKSGNNGRGNGR